MADFGCHDKRWIRIHGEFFEDADMVYFSDRYLPHHHSAMNINEPINEPLVFSQPITAGCEVSFPGFLAKVRMQIFFKDLKGGTQSLEVEPSTTIEELIAQVHQKVGEGLLVEVFFAGKALHCEPTRPLSDYHIHKESSVYVRVKQHSESSIAETSRPAHSRCVML